METKNYTIKHLTFHFCLVLLFLLGTDVTIKAQCTPSYTYTVDQNGLFHFTNTSTGNYTSNSWFSTSNVIATTANNPVLNLPSNQEGYYEFCLYIEDSTTSCSAYYCDTIFLHDVNPSQSCYASFGQFDSAGVSYFINTSVAASNNIISHWDFGDGTSLTSSDDIVNHVYAGEGYYNVCLTTTDTLNNCSDTMCYNMHTFGQDCYFNFNIYQDQNQPNTYNVYVNSPSGANYTYYWAIDNGGTQLFYTQQYPPTIIANIIPGNLFYICAEVWGNITPNACHAGDCDSTISNISRNDATQITINFFPGIATNIEAIEMLSNFETYPNPFSNSTNVQYTLAKEGMIELSVLDVLGNQIKVIEKQQKNAGNHSIPLTLEGYSDGIYFLQLKTESLIKTKKIIVNH